MSKKKSLYVRRNWTFGSNTVLVVLEPEDSRRMQVLRERLPPLKEHTDAEILLWLLRVSSHSQQFDEPRQALSKWDNPSAIWDQPGVPPDMRPAPAIDPRRPRIEDLAKDPQPPGIEDSADDLQPPEIQNFKD